VRHTRGRKLFVLLPIFNEASSLENILVRVSRSADRLVLVDDGSSDATPSILKRFAKQRVGTYLLRLPENRGMAGALETGFRFVIYLQKIGEASSEDVLATMDADGQHRPEYLPNGQKILCARGLDVLLTKRDFRVYPLYKIIGNRFLTFTNRILSGYPYQDVESGMRFIRMGALPSILKFYLGRRYSCAQEIALLSVRQGLKVSNDYNVDVPCYRPGTTVWDGFVVLAYSIAAYGRWLLNLPVHKKDETAFFETALRNSKKIWPTGRKVTGQRPKARYS
jgi:glycosyltransferase involved in cell wall biosynthesis